MPTVQGKVYEAIIKECERMEQTGQYTGNGHHLAQRIAEMIEKAKTLIVAPNAPLAIAEWVPHQPETWPFRYGSLKKPTIMTHHNREVSLAIGTTVKIVMASRFGDIGITDDLATEHGYGARINLEDLDDLRNSPEATQPQSKPLDCLKYCPVVTQPGNEP